MTSFSPSLLLSNPSSLPIFVFTQFYARSTAIFFVSLCKTAKNRRNWHSCFYINWRQRLVIVFRIFATLNSSIVLTCEKEDLAGVEITTLGIDRSEATETRKTFLRSDETTSKVESARETKQKSSFAVASTSTSVSMMKATTLCIRNETALMHLNKYYVMKGN